MQELDQIKLIPINKINILNPRVRSRKQHQAIVDSISKTGLRRPISVRVRTDQTHEFEYDLICGQGRIEAFKILGQDEIWACILDITEDQCMIMSLVENIARFNHSSIEQLREIEALRKRGNSHQNIAEKIGTTESWVRMVLSLLARGESRLLAAVENETIPIGLAIDIARSSTAEIQDLLTEALENKKIQPRKVAAIRNILDKREKGLKAQPQNNVFGRNSIKSNKTSIEELYKICQEEAEEHELSGKKAQLCQETLIFLGHAFKKLITNPTFYSLLQQQGFSQIPQILQHLIDNGLTYEEE